MPMVTTPTFLPFMEIGVSGPMHVLNCVAYTQNEPYRKGGRQRAFDGNMLSTEQGNKYSARATVEFLSADDMFDFERITSADWDDQLQRSLVTKACWLLAGGSNTTLGRVGQGLQVYVRIVSRTPFEHLVAHETIARTSVLTIGWRCELEIEEV